MSHPIPAAISRETWLAYPAACGGYLLIDPRGARRTLAPTLIQALLDVAATSPGDEAVVAYRDEEGALTLLPVADLGEVIRALSDDAPALVPVARAAELAARCTDS